jgi:hypothetical protein
MDRSPSPQKKLHNGTVSRYHAKSTHLHPNWPNHHPRFLSSSCDLSNRPPPHHNPPAVCREQYSKVVQKKLRYKKEILVKNLKPLSLNDFPIPLYFAAFLIHLELFLFSTFLPFSQ